ncbi:MAG: hypothetical protein KMY55_14565 [Dethiosulfatibacter sp.]|nr:hypothetical protein [Dethiosulfatibacter sp.]
MKNARVLGLLLLLVLGIGLMVGIGSDDEVYASEVTNFQYSISNGEVTITNYIGDDTIVEIPVTIEGYTVHHVTL